MATTACQVAHLRCEVRKLRDDPTLWHEVKIFIEQVSFAHFEISSVDSQ